MFVGGGKSKKKYKNWRAKGEEKNFFFVKIQIQSHLGGMEQEGVWMIFYKEEAGEEG